MDASDEEVALSGLGQYSYCTLMTILGMPFFLNFMKAITKIWVADFSFLHLFFLGYPLLPNPSVPSNSVI